MGDKQEQGTLLNGVVQCVHGLMFAILKRCVLVSEFGILREISKLTLSSLLL